MGIVWDEQKKKNYEKVMNTIGTHFHILFFITFCDAGKAKKPRSERQLLKRKWNWSERWKGGRVEGWKAEVDSTTIFKGRKVIKILISTFVIRRIKTNSLVTMIEKCKATNRTSTHTHYFLFRNTLFHKPPVDFLASNIFVLWKSARTARDMWWRK